MAPSGSNVSSPYSNPTGTSSQTRPSVRPLIRRERLRPSSQPPPKASAVPARSALAPVAGVLAFDELTDTERIVLWRIAGALTGRQAGHDGVVIGDAEEWQRVALAPCAVEHAVLGGGEPVVRPARHHVADVDDVSSW